MPKSNNKRKNKKGRGPTQAKVRQDQVHNEADDTLVDIVEVRDQAQSFVDKYRNTIIGVGGILLLLAGGYMIYKKMVAEPQEAEAFDQISQAIYQFERDSFALALQNPGAGFDGFEVIVDDFGGTDAGNISRYYAGISHLNLGNFDRAIEYLEDFKPAGSVSPIMKAGALGDAYADKQDYDKALSMYKKAAGVSENQFLNSYYLKKYGMLLMHQGQIDEAQKVFDRIVKEYPNSLDASEVKKYVTSAQ